MKILLLESDKNKINWFKNTFASIDVTSNVDEAYSLIKNNKYDIIFLSKDTNDSKVNGEDLAWKMYQERLASSTPIIVHDSNFKNNKIIKRYLSQYNKNVSCIKYHDLVGHSVDQIKKMAGISKENNQNIKQSQFSIDLLLKEWEGKGSLYRFLNNNKEAEDILYTIWKNENNKLGARTYIKPENVDNKDIKKIINAGFVEEKLGKLQITSSGAEKLKAIILSDEQSALEKGKSKEKGILNKVAQKNISEKNQSYLDVLESILKNKV